MTQFAKGAVKQGGRVKGTPNLVTMELRAMVLKALEKVGGVDYLVQQSEENPVAFMSLLAKSMPKEVSIDLSAQVAIQHKIVGVAVKAKE